MRALLDEPAHGDGLLVSQRAADDAVEMLGPFHLPHPGRVRLVADDHGVLVQIFDFVYVYRQTVVVGALLSLCERSRSLSGSFEERDRGRVEVDRVNLASRVAPHEYGIVRVFRIEPSTFSPIQERDNHVRRQLTSAYQ